MNRPNLIANQETYFQSLSVVTGAYQVSISIGVSDGTIAFELSAGDSYITDRFVIAEFNNTTITSQAILDVNTVPEPSAILGTITFLGVVLSLKRKGSRTTR